MTMTYNGLHSITFIKGSIGDEYYVKNSWTDFHLIPSRVFSPPVPSVQYSIVDTPFTSNSIDYTDAILNGVKLIFPSETYDFIIDNDNWNSWFEAKEELTDYFNGKRMYFVFEDDPKYAYTGRFVVSGWEDGSNYSSISISCYLDSVIINNTFVY